MTSDVTGTRHAATAPSSSPIAVPTPACSAEASLAAPGVSIERQQREPERVGEAHEPGGGTEAGRRGRGARLGGVGDAAIVPAADADQHARVCAAGAIAGELEPRLEVVVEVGTGLRAPGVAGTLHAVPAVGRSAQIAERAGDVGRACDPARTRRQQRHGAAQRRVQGELRLERVDEAGGELALGGERPAGVARVLVAHPAAGERHLRTRQRQHDVGGRRERDPHPAGGRVSQDGDVRDAVLPCLDGGGGDPLQLQQRPHPFLHAGAARGDDGDDRHLALPRVLERAHDLVARRLAQRSAQEAEVELDEHRGVGVDEDLGDVDGLLPSAARPGAVERVAISRPPERVARGQRRRRAR